MDDFLKRYRQLNAKQKILAEITFYSYIAFHTNNESRIKVTKTRGNTIDGKKVLKYEIEVPTDVNE